MAKLTSQTHPLRIDAVVAPGGGYIGMTFCPGKKQKNSLSGHWDRDLATDLAVISAWGARALVTLMEPEDLANVGVSHLGDAVEALGLDWYHLPIRDVQPPGQRFENRWILYGLKLRRLLRQGSRVVIHCRGGLGRTGTVTARLLVEMGMPPEEAMQAVRTARPGTIETAAQEAHVRDARPPELDEAFLDRALGCLLGGAIGDGFGYAIEFDSLNQIQHHYGPAGLREPVFKDGRLVVSDDTQMTLFTLEGMTRTPRGAGPDILVANIASAYADWLDTQGGQHKGYAPHGTLAKRPAIRHCRAPGNTCLSALLAGGGGTLSHPLNASKGCGAVMRVAPLGWLASQGRDHLFDLGTRTGVLTHGHEAAWASAGLLADLVGRLFGGHGLTSALKEAVAMVGLMAQGKHVDLITIVGRAEHCAKRQRATPQQAIAVLGQGWVGDEALAIALYSVLSASSFADAIRRAANHGGDSDSTASIAGQLWGAWKGLDALPMAWVRRLDVLPECLHGVGELAKQGYRAVPTATLRRATVPEPYIQTCLNILEMVHILHRRGYQRLRIAPGLAPSGCCWRVSVAPWDNFQADNGSLLRNFEDAVHHTTGNGELPFEWRDGRGKNPQELADLFLARHPELAERGWGADWAYAGWYLEVLAQAARGLFPAAYGDWYEQPDPRYLVLTGPSASGQQRMPAPPLGPDTDFPVLLEDECEVDPALGGGIDPEEVDLRTYDLSEDHGRVQALVCFYHQMGKSLIPFTAQVWDALTEPRNAKVVDMAEELGTGGTGKVALRKLLECYLQTTDAAVAQAEYPIEGIDGETDPVGWQQAHAKWHDNMSAILYQHAKRWSRLLNGEPMDLETSLPGKVIEGPWLKSD
ncbi:MAG: ADP-ribosylglycohydrolase family protein [Chromatiaceae bacterium]|nr:ADP-ribosylglycohydrolase family protein [Chromatiaceae bacterium]MBP6733320.1 ADP-ribosylglycohydrolase family protein [Chromatiaceae bacterium]MBP6806814.1 ADP-ribosylglycohydrolase family protein [Chromatiaceae bacterium]MBP8282501.1 ADP-ribosylglycohydrolase family protein [Chromatiaceae bacterium]MBP8288415.1 ADP-ribosylglycohydrolase family protein [Chromatiaceae bacterium]